MEGSDEQGEKQNLLASSKEELPVKQALKRLMEFKKDIITLVIMLCLSDFAGIIIETLLTLYLIEQWDMSDFISGMCLGLYGLMSGIASTYTGTLPVRLGFRTALLVASILISAGMFSIGFAVAFVMVVTPLYTIVAAGVSINEPIIISLMQLYCPPECITVANIIFSAAYCLAFMMSSVVISIFWGFFTNEHWAYAAIFSFSGGLGILSCFLSYTLGKPQFVDFSAEEEETGITFGQAMKHPRSPRFVFFIGLFTLALSFNSIMPVVLPIYMIREYGDDADWGMVLFVLGLASLMAIAFISPCLIGESNYTIIVWGCFTQMASVFVFMVPGTESKCSIGAILFGLGTIYYPRVYDYVLEVAPPKHESIYLTLCNIPFKTPLFVQGLLGGILLQVFMPEDGDTQGWLMWGIIGAGSAVTSFSLFILRPKIELPPFKEEKAIE